MNLECVESFISQTSEKDQRFHFYKINYDIQQTYETAKNYLIYIFRDF